MTFTKHRVFFSFHYERDAGRVARIREHPSLPLICNDWESMKMNSGYAIERWIDGQMEAAACTVVLIGGETATRDWIRYEIEKSWNDGKGLFGVYIHEIPDEDGRDSIRGANPFDNVMVGGCALSRVVQLYDPHHAERLNACDYISHNIEQWIDEAIQIRNSGLN